MSRLFVEIIGRYLPPLELVMFARTNSAVRGWLSACTTLIELQLHMIDYLTESHTILQYYAANNAAMIECPEFVAHILRQRCRTLWDSIYGDHTICIPRDLRMWYAPYAAAGDMSFADILYHSRVHNTSQEAYYYSNRRCYPMLARAIRYASSSVIVSVLDVIIREDNRAAWNTVCSGDWVAIVQCRWAERDIIDMFIKYSRYEIAAHYIAMIAAHDSDRLYTLRWTTALEYPEPSTLSGMYMVPPSTDEMMYYLRSPERLSLSWLIDAGYITADMLRAKYISRTERAILSRPVWEVVERCAGKLPCILIHLYAHCSSVSRTNSLIEYMGWIYIDEDTTVHLLGLYKNIFELYMIIRHHHAHADIIARWIAEHGLQSDLRQILLDSRYPLRYESRAIYSAVCYPHGYTASDIDVMCDRAADAQLQYVVHTTANPTHLGITSQLCFHGCTGYHVRLPDHPGFTKCILRYRQEKNET